MQCDSYRRRERGRNREKERERDRERERERERKRVRRYSILIYKVEENHRETRRDAV